MYARGLQAYVDEGVAGVELDDDDPLVDQWTVLFEGEDPVCLAARDLHGPDALGERSFEYATTYDPEVVRQVAASLGVPCTPSGASLQDPGLGRQDVAALDPDREGGQRLLGRTAPHGARGGVEARAVARAAQLAVLRRDGAALVGADRAEPDRGRLPGAGHDDGLAARAGGERRGADGEVGQAQQRAGRGPGGHGGPRGRGARPAAAAGDERRTAQAPTSSVRRSRGHVHSSSSSGSCPESTRRVGARRTSAGRLLPDDVC